MSWHLDPISKCESVGCWSYKLTIFCLAFCKHPKQVEKHFPSAASSGFVSFSRISNGHSTYVIDLVGLTGRLKRLKAAKPIPKNPRILKSAEIVKSLEVAHWAYNYPICPHDSSPHVISGSQASRSRSRPTWTSTSFSFSCCFSCSFSSCRNWLNGQKKKTLATKRS